MTKLSMKSILLFFFALSFAAENLTANETADHDDGRPHDSVDASASYLYLLGLCDQGVTCDDLNEVCRKVSNGGHTCLCEQDHMRDASGTCVSIRDFALAEDPIQIIEAINVTPTVAGAISQAATVAHTLGQHDLKMMVKLLSYSVGTVMPNCHSFIYPQLDKDTTAAMVFNNHAGGDYIYLHIRRNEKINFIVICPL